jgi:hypothetical protein
MTTNRGRNPLYHELDLDIDFSAFEAELREFAALYPQQTRSLLKFTIAEWHSGISDMFSIDRAGQPVSPQDRRAFMIRMSRPLLTKPYLSETFDVTTLCLSRRRTGIHVTIGACFVDGWPFVADFLRRCEDLWGDKPTKSPPIEDAPSSSPVLSQDMDLTLRPDAPNPDKEGWEITLVWGNVHNLTDDELAKKISKSGNTVRNRRKRHGIPRRQPKKDQV